MNKVNINDNNLEHSLYFKFISETTFQSLIKMGFSKLMILKWQRQRLITSVVAMVIFSFVFLIYRSVLVLPVILSSFAYYFYQGQKVERCYAAFKFERNLEFAKFARLVIPYLRQAKYGVSIFQILSQMVPRMNQKSDQQSLRSLMVEMSENPHEIEYFHKFAEKMGGTDFAITFMSLLFDISQGATDDRIIDELGQEVSKQLLHAIDDIISFKQKRFILFPTKLTMIQFILIIGYFVCILLYEIAKMGKIGNFSFN